MIPAMQRGDPQWSELRAVGVGWWIRNINTLRKMVEKVPRPTQTIFFYLISILHVFGLHCIISERVKRVRSSHTS